MLEGSIGNFTSRVLATFAALPRALRLGVLRSSWYLAALGPSARGLCSGWLGVVGFFVETHFPDTEFFVFFGLECSGGVR